VSVESLLIGFGGLLLSAVTFALGKIFSQSENILDRKREIYASFLKLCPAPNEAHSEEFFDFQAMQREMGVLTIYGSPDALKFAADYFNQFAISQEILAGVEEAGHPEFFKVMTAYNRMVWAMRVDTMTWSVFAPTKNAREYKPSFNID
jgi:hypothetical protein